MGFRWLRPRIYPAGVTVRWFSPRRHCASPMVRNPSCCLILKVETTPGIEPGKRPPPAADHADDGAQAPRAHLREDGNTPAGRGGAADPAERRRHRSIATARPEAPHEYDFQLLVIRRAIDADGHWNCREGAVEHV